MTRESDIDLLVDFNTEDATGLAWTDTKRAKDPSEIVVGWYVVAGMKGTTAVVKIVDVRDDGLVHVLPVPGSVEENRHLLDAQPSSAWAYLAGALRTGRADEARTTAELRFTIRLELRLLREPMPWAFGVAVMTEPIIDILVDLQTEDETGLPWTFLADATDPSLIVPGRYVIAGARRAATTGSFSSRYLEAQSRGSGVRAIAPQSAASEVHMSSVCPEARQ